MDFSNSQTDKKKKEVSSIKIEENESKKSYIFILFIYYLVKNKNLPNNQQNNILDKPPEFLLSVSSNDLKQKDDLYTDIQLDVNLTGTESRSIF